MHLSFDELPELDPRFKSVFKVTSFWYAQNHSIWHLKNMFYRSKDLFAFKAKGNPEPISEISEVDLLNYKDAVGAQREWHLSAISGFLKKWASIGLVGISEGAVVLLQQIRLKGNEKGVATATMDPVRGPLTPIELEALQTALNSAYARGEVGKAEYVLCWLLMMLG